MTDARDPDMLAGELALGLLDGRERAAALRRMLAEPPFAAEVAWWREALGPLFDEVPAAEPPAGGFDRVERMLDGVPTPVVRRGWLWPSLAGAGALAAVAQAVRSRARVGQRVGDARAGALLGDKSWRHLQGTSSRLSTSFTGLPRRNTIREAYPRHF